MLLPRRGRGVCFWCLAVVAIVAGAGRANARCDASGADAAAIAAARADVEISCPCSSFSTHSAYVRCSRDVLAARIAAMELTRSCKSTVQRCARRSTCGRPGTVSCCSTTAAGIHRCSIKRDASRCIAPAGGSACAGARPSCCEACSSMGGCVPAATPTPSPSSSPTATPCTGPCQTIQTVFIILMENHNWSQIKNSASAPYINNTLLPMAAHAEQYYNPPGIHPSEPNYLWLEAGTNFGILNDSDPSANHQSSTNHLVTLLGNAGISWKAYQEDISGTSCPLTNQGLYAVRHDPLVYFDDVTNTNNPLSATCLTHVRPYTELAADLSNNTVARYNFITPNVCNDMHDSCAPAYNPVQQGDTWLSTEVPKILTSPAYTDLGVLLITWDEGVAGDGPIGMIVLSPHGKGGGYSNTIHYTHSSTLRTVQEILGVSPLLGDAAHATDLADLFTTLP